MSEHAAYPPQRVALVTGAASGIGRATAVRLACDGHRVVGGWHAKRPAVGMPDIIDVQLDVTDASSVDRAFDRIESDIGPVTIVVANAGTVEDHVLPRMTDAAFTALVDVHLTGTLRLCRRATAAMRSARFGRIVLVSSVAGLIGMPAQSNYAAAKAGMIGLGRSVAHELGGRGVTVNVVAPGPIDTNLFNALPRPQQEAWLERVPLGRIGTTEEVADTISFLCSDRAAFTTGALLTVDGGLVGVGPWIQ